MQPTTVRHAFTAPSREPRLASQPSFAHTDATLSRAPSQTTVESALFVIVGALVGLRLCGKRLTNVHIHIYRHSKQDITFLRYQIQLAAIVLCNCTALTYGAWLQPRL